MLRNDVRLETGFHLRTNSKVNSNHVEECKRPNEFDLGHPIPPQFGGRHFQSGYPTGTARTWDAHFGVGSSKFLRLQIRAPTEVETVWAIRAQQLQGQRDSWLKFGVR